MVRDLIYVGEMLRMWHESLYVKVEKKTVLEPILSATRNTEMFYIPNYVILFVFLLNVLGGTG